jgi:hypothetical protein
MLRRLHGMNILFIFFSLRSLTVRYEKMLFEIIT